MNYERVGHHILPFDAGSKGRLLHCPGCCKIDLKRGVYGQESALQCLSCGFIFQTLSLAAEALATLTDEERDALLKIAVSDAFDIPEEVLSALEKKTLIKNDGEWVLTDKGEGYVEALDP